MSVANQTIPIKKYLTQKEAIARYGYSAAWFERERWIGTGPGYFKVRHKVLYPIVETDAWFEQKGLFTSTSQESNYKYFLKNN